MKAINTKKIIALTTGLAMVGATIFGAAAQDLSQYPSPLFIKDGVFDGSIVVGELAKTSDVIGSIELAAGLQAAAVKKTILNIGAGSSVIDKGVKIDKSGNHLGYNKYLFNVQDSDLDSGSLPDLMPSGLYDDSEGNTKNKVDYDQRLSFSATGGQVVFTQDDEDAPNAGPYLWFNSNVNMYNYTLKFNEDVDFDSTSTTTATEDFQSTKVNMLGKTYTVTDAHISSGAIDKMTLLAGDTTRWMTQDEPLDREIGGAKHTFTLVDVNEGEDKCGVSVDGTVQWIDKGQTKTINGIQIGVTDAITVHSAGKDTDVCEVNLGATELKLENSNEVKLNGVSLAGSQVTFTGGAGTLRSLGIVYQPDNDVFLGEGAHYTEPIFDAFTFYFDGMTKDKTEAINLDASGKSADLHFLNSDNKDVKISWKMNNSNVIVLGTDSDKDKRIYLQTQACGYNQAVETVKSCEGSKFLVITSGGEAHLLKILNFDTSNAKIKLHDETYGSDSEDDFNTSVLGSAQTIDLGSGAGSVTVTLKANQSNVGNNTQTLNFTSIAGNGGVSKTSLNNGNNGAGTAGLVIPSYDQNGTAFKFTEETQDNYGGAIWNATISVDTADTDINVGTPTISPAGSFIASGIDANKDDNDHSYYVTNWSTTAYFDNKDNNFVHIEYPDSYRYGQVFVGEAEAKITSAGGAVESVQVQQIPVGSAKLDKDVTDWSAQNLIVVGGPCANTVAAALLGNPADCSAGFKEGEGIIQLFKASTGKVSLLAAGYSALDTRRVSRVLANYKDYASSLKGTEVKVKGTSLSDISIEAVA
jgi:hypothetical protein